MLAGFLGAGFSRWAANLPLANELFDFNVRVRGPRESRRFDLVEEEWLAWKSTNPTGLSEQFIAAALNFPSVRRKRIIWYVSRRLSDPFLCRIIGGTATYMIDDRRVRNMPEVIRAQKFLQRFLGSTCSGLVTCNYDLLVEYALTTKYFNYGVRGEKLYGRGANPWFPGGGAHPILRGSLSLAKIHGSLSWDSNKRFTDGRRGLSGAALIIPPRPEKTVAEALASVWILAEKILKNATRLVVFGFAFNPYDEAVLDLLSRAGSNLTEVLLIDVNPKTEIAAKIWPQARIFASGPPDQDTVGLDRWFD